MEIRICEDNGCMCADGKPSLVVLVVMFDNGNQVRVPYEAGKTIADLYFDIKKLDKQGAGTALGGENITTLLPIDIKKEQQHRKEMVYPGVTMSEPEAKPLAVDQSLTIQREDLVKVVNVLPRFKDQTGNELMDPGIEAGGIYRVMKINKAVIVDPSTQELVDCVNNYEIINDKSATPVRLIAYPGEVVLHQKRKGKISKVTRMEEIVKCECGFDNSLFLNNKTNKYEGVCSNPECGQSLVADRPKKKETANV